MRVIIAAVSVHTCVEGSIKTLAGIVLKKMGLIVSDTARILHTRVANERALPTGLTVDQDAHKAWFKAKIREALDEKSLPIADEDVKSHFASAVLQFCQRLRNRLETVVIVLWHLRKSHRQGQGLRHPCMEGGVGGVGFKCALKWTLASCVKN